MCRACFCWGKQERSSPAFAQGGVPPSPCRCPAGGLGGFVVSVAELRSKTSRIAEAMRWPCARFQGDRRALDKCVCLACVVRCGRRLASGRRSAQRCPVPQAWARLGAAEHAARARARRLKAWRPSGLGLRAERGRGPLVPRAAGVARAHGAQARARALRPVRSHLAHGDVARALFLACRRGASPPVQLLRCVLRPLQPSDGSRFGLSGGRGGGLRPPASGLRRARGGHLGARS